MKMSSRIMGIYSEKDKDSIITSCNEVFLDYAGVNSDNNILGLTDYDFPWSEYADIYRAHEIDAYSGHHYSTIIPLKSHEGDDLLFLHTKIQKVNAAGESVGTTCRAIEIINPDTAQLIKLLSNNSNQKKVYYLDKKCIELNLSKRQSEVLFYLARGKKTKTIAVMLGLSARTVEKYIDNLRDKLDCRTRWELVDFALKNGFADIIPVHSSAKELLEKMKA